MAFCIMYACDDILNRVSNFFMLDLKVSISSLFVLDMVILLFKYLLCWMPYYAFDCTQR